MIFIIQGFLQLYCYIQNVLVDISYRLLQMLLVELGNLLWTSNNVFYQIHGVGGSDFVNHNQVQVLSITVLLPTCSQDWTGKL